MTTIYAKSTSRRSGSFTRAIRTLPGRRGKLPIVAMTANAFAEDVQMAKNTGMDGHIAKTLDFGILSRILSKYHLDYQGKTDYND